MVARPDTEKEAGGCRHEHAEKKLLDNLDQLLQSFKSEYGSLPGMALLYTWTTPCPRCTNELLNANNLIRRRYLGAEIRFTISYSVNKVWKTSGMTLPKNEENRPRLRNAGVTVMEVSPSSGGGCGGRGNLGLSIYGP